LCGAGRAATTFLPKMIDAIQAFRKTPWRGRRPRQEGPQSRTSYRLSMPALMVESVLRTSFVLMGSEVVSCLCLLFCDRSEWPDNSFLEFSNQT
jgi:hypothetical protein